MSTPNLNTYNSYIFRRLSTFQISRSIFLSFVLCHMRLVGSEVRCGENHVLSSVFANADPARPRSSGRPPETAVPRREEAAGRGGGCMCTLLIYIVIYFSLMSKYHWNCAYSSLSHQILIWNWYSYCERRVLFPTR